MVSRLGAMLAVALLVVGCDGGAIDGAGGGGAATGVTSGTGVGTPTATGSTSGAGGAGEIPAEEDPFDPPPSPPVLDDASLAAIGEEIDAALGRVSGATHSALVVGLDSGQVVYERTPDTVRTPASNTKLFTTAAALVSLGGAHRPRARVFGDVAGATVTGDLVVVAEHDAAISTWFGDRSAQPFDALAGVLAARGIESVTGDVVVEGEVVFEGDPLGTIDYAGERAQAASALRSALSSHGIAVGGVARGASGFDAPTGGAEIAALPGVALDALVHAINVPSHNEMADLTMHHVGFAAIGESTYAAGESVVLGMLDDAGIDGEGLALHDGSGLSHQNRVTPRQIVELFESMLARPEGPAYLRSMAVSGLRGTIGNRLAGADTEGRFWGKTGTLTGVVALSGVLFHRHDGQRYVASFLSNGVGDSTTGRAGLDDAVRAVAKDRRGAVALPGVVEMESVTDDANGETALVRWREVPAATGYLVWRSRDGLVFAREDARLVTGTSHRTRRLDGAERLFVRVTAVGDAGEGLPSSVLGASTSDDGARVLVVDGNDRARLQPIAENPLGWGNMALVRNAAAIATSFESCDNRAVEDGTVDLGRYDLVVYALGREGVEHESLSTTEQERLAAYVAAGGRLLVSGSELAFDLVGQGSPDDAAFARDVLGLDYVGDDAGTSIVAPAVAGYAPALARFGWLGEDEVPFPDVIAPAAGGMACASYAAGEVGAACVSRATPGDGRVVVLGVPLEAFDDPELRRAFVALVST